MNKKLFGLGFVFIFNMVPHNVNWPSLITKYQHLVSQQTYFLILNQYQAYAEKFAPAIADSVIKNIPIHEMNEELIDLQKTDHPRIKIMSEKELLLAHTYPEDIDPRAATYSMMRMSLYLCLQKMIIILDQMAGSFGYEPGQLEIRLFEGLRDLATQKELFDNKLKNIKQKNSVLSDEEAYMETCKWVSPYINNVPPHSTGAAIDIHLWDNKNKRFCDMGRFNVGGKTAPTFSIDVSITEKQALNRLLFIFAASESGLVNYVYEFWHFSYKDRYAAYWLQKTSSSYGSI